MEVRISAAFRNEMRITSTSTNSTSSTSTRDHTTISAKCTKMTEGVNRIHGIGMNGVNVNDSGNGNNTTTNAAVIVKEEKNLTVSDRDCGTTPPDIRDNRDTYSNLGGRLKFFKNGRFILELARAREGEKVAWVPVPKKTFWPPPGSTSSLSTYRQESSTSLSVSDDNSSIQSSPWQRDHTWKQTSPQRNISSNLSFYFTKRKTASTSTQIPCWQYKLQRSPYLTEQQRTKCNKTNKCNNSKCVNLIINNKSAMCLRRKKLVHVVEFLWTKTLQTFNSITSPRKRILRELERVTIDDDLSIYNKRCRGKIVAAANQIKTQHSLSAGGGGSSSSNNNKNNNIDNTNNGGLVQNNRLDLNGCEEKQQCRTSYHHQQQQQQQSSGGKNCSYSITSLLGDENKIEKSSTTSSSSVISHPYTDCTNGPSNKNTVDILLKNNKRSPIPRGRSPDSTPSPSHYNYHMSHPPTAQFMSPYPIYSSVLHHHPANYISPYYHHHQQQQQHHQGPSSYGAVRPSAFYQPLFGPRHEPQYSPPWNTYEQHHLQGSTLHRDDTSDVPLNLSKHAD